MKYIFLFCLSVLVSAELSADAQPQDTVRLLEEVQVSAYAHGRPLAEIPAAVSVIGKTDFNRFSNTSLLPLLNNQPGIRMEERSPGSYRLSIRGSSLRSPFGVRNVKVYWNGIPFTDPGGNTYLNL
ncbi:MAG: TonB-dependent receptor plug domain-containing protein, partial [Bacteroidota bacterium]